MLRDVLSAYRRAITADDAASEDFAGVVERWMEGGSFGVFAFDRVCRTIGVDARRLRRRMKALRNRAREDALWRENATG